MIAKRIIPCLDVSSLAEIAALRDMGVAAAILGRALYTGRLDLAWALAVARGEERA